MIDIRRYTHSTILSAAEKFQQRFENGDINSFEYIQQLNIFRLRDINGMYCFLDPRTKKFYLFENSHWQFCDTEPNVFEAPNLISFLENSEEYNENNLLKILEESEPKKMPAEKVIIAIVDVVGTGFERGTLTSTEAQNLLAQQIITDLEGRFWTQGIKSRRWYYFKDMQWHKSEGTPPHEDQLFHLKNDEYKCLSCGKVVEDTSTCPYCGSDKINGMEVPPAKVVNALPEFMLFGVDTLPENVTDLWDPPTSFPDEVVKAEQNKKSSEEKLPSSTNNVSSAQLEEKVAAESSIESTYKCPSCRALVDKNQKFCTRCGEKLPENLEPVQEEPIIKTCPVCGAVFKPDTKFCTHCGTKVSTD